MSLFTHPALLFRTLGIEEKFTDKVLMTLGIQRVKAVRNSRFLVHTLTAMGTFWGLVS